jgi:type III secretion protein D
MYKLKWLNGPLAGFEFELPEGQVRIGGADADIAVPLEAGAQAVLMIGKDGVNASQGVPVWIDGLPWNAADALPLHRAIDIAGLAFVLGLVSDKLESLAVPVRRRAPARHRRIWFIGIGAAISAGMMFVGLGLWLWQSAVPKPDDRDTWLAKQLDVPSLRTVHVARASDGSYVLSGKCASSKDIDRLRVLLAEKGAVMRDETLCADTLRESIRNVLALYGYRDVEVSIDEEIECAQIRGQIVDDASWQRVASRLQTLVGLRAWHVVNDRALWFEHLYEALTTRELVDGLSIAMSGKALNVSGAVSVARERAIGHVVDEFNRSNTHGFVATWHNIPSLQKPGGWLPAPIVSVGGCASASYVTLANGMRLQPGCVLPNGFVIVSITRHSISLRKEQRLVSLQLNV